MNIVYPQSHSTKRETKTINGNISLLLLLLALSTGQIFAAEDVVLGAGSNQASGETSSKPPQPNIIVILSDDMGYSDIGCFGGEIHTPHLDRLAANGLRYTQFYNTARCCPTRASLLTGLYPHQAGIGNMLDDLQLPGYRGNLTRNAVTIAEALQPAGYTSYVSGKWHLTPVSPNKDNWPLQRGFRRFYGTIHGAGSFWDPNTLTRDNEYISPFADPEYQPKDGFYYTDAISDHAARFIREHQDGPFFLYVAYTAAHWPLHARDRDIAKYQGVYDQGYDAIRRARFQRMKQLGIIGNESSYTPTLGNWEKEENKKKAARDMETYAAMVDSMDQGIGRIISALKESNQFENTLILYLQDNGACDENFFLIDGADGSRASEPSLEPLPSDYLQTHMIPKQNRDGYPMRTGPNVMAGPDDTYISYGRLWANVSNTPFREYKKRTHEGGISTPLIAHWPAGIQRSGGIESQPGHLIDIMATCLELSGASYPEKYQSHSIIPLEGLSLVPSFSGEPLAHDTLFFEHKGNRAIRQGDWKLVAKDRTGPWELYDLSQDRSETNNLAQENPKRVGELATAWEHWAQRTHAKPWPRKK
jgi:arylsulfatase A-like enzyme